MARFKDINYPELGQYIRELIKDPQKMEDIKSGRIDLKEELKSFMTPRDVSWDVIKFVPHFDEANVVNLSFPFTGDVEASIAAFCPPEGQEGEEYTFPKHYTEDPNAGKDEKARKETRKRLYLSRIGDYVMARCK